MMCSVHWNQLSLDMYHILEADTHTETKFGSQCMLRIQLKYATF